MKIIPKTLLALVICGGLNSSVKAQSSSNVPITNFDGVAVSSGIDLYLMQSNAENIKVSAHPDLIKNVLVSKEGNTLKIAYKDNISWGKLFKGQSIKVYVNYKTLESLTASGGSDVFTQNTMRTPKLAIKASGGSDLKMDIITKDIEIQSSGGSDLDIKGSADNMSLTCSGGSDVNAYNFLVNYAKVTASGGSDANIHVSKGLEANASGGSDIKYKGDAAVRKTSSSKSGDVTKID